MIDLNIIVPQYHSSYCRDNCKYCGFKKDNLIIPRDRLSDEDFKAELELLISWGYRTIEFVYASDTYFSPDRIAERIEYAKNISEQRNLDLRIGLNAEPFDYKGYKTLKDSGLDFFVIWMETYNRERYNFWHDEKMPKFDFENRYNSYEVAIEAGLINYGMGILFGLNDWKEDVQALVNHGNILKQKYDIPPYIIGVPRIKRANSVHIEKDMKFVSDKEFLQAISTYKREFPETMIFFNTREEFELNIKACSENDLFTVDCGTYPRAFLKPDVLQNDTEQFHTYQYDRNESVIKLKEVGFNPRFVW